MIDRMKGRVRTTTATIRIFVKGGGLAGAAGFGLGRRRLAIGGIPLAF